jgi:hypothetical protein
MTTVFNHSLLTFSKIQEICSMSCSSYKDIDRAWLFGSFARGDATDSSDIDLRLELAEDSHFNLFDLVHLADAIEGASGRNCDIITSRNIKSKALAQSIQNEKVLVYERQEK